MMEKYSFHRHISASMRQRQRKTWPLSLLICFLAIGLMSGCSKEKETDSAKRHIYYVNAKGTALVTEGWNPAAGNAEEEIESALDKMRESPDPAEYKSVFPDGVNVENWTLNDTKLDVYFNSGYTDMNAAQEVLLRAAVVKSLVQIDGVEYVDFFVGEIPLANLEGQEIGYMRGEDFVQNTGSSLHSYQMANLQLYFASDKGDTLVKEEVNVRYNSNISIEKLTVEQLIKGPSGNGKKPVIPPETKVLGVSAKDNICYVNFDEGFLKADYAIRPETTIYSIVNSIVEGGTAGQVQISVNGETNLMYQEAVDLSEPLSRNLDLVQEK